MIPTEGYKQLIADFRSYVTGDPWAECMEAFFAVAGEMRMRDLEIPEVWHYGPGAMSDPRDPDGIWFEMLTAVDDETLTQFGAVLSRYSDLLRSAEMNY